MFLYYVNLLQKYFFCDEENKVHVPWKESAVMPKMKTKKCAVKRMKLSKSGKVMRSQGGHAHLNNGKKRNRKNNLCGRTTIDSLKVTKTYSRALQGR